AIVMRTLEKRPADRPATGDEIVKALSVTVTPRHTGGGRVVESLANAPRWVPWMVAGVSTTVAIVIAVMYVMR
ncbi:MAG: hypothetical protein ABJC63_09325, partial [Gemmatimonadales bacterium]